MVALIVLLYLSLSILNASNRWSDLLEYDSNSPTPPNSDCWPWAALAQLETMSAQIARLETENDALRRQINFERDQIADERRFHWEDRTKMQREIDSTNQQLQEMKFMQRMGEMNCGHLDYLPPSPPPYPDSVVSESSCTMQSLPSMYQSSEPESPIMGIPMTQPMMEPQCPDLFQPKPLNHTLYKTKFCRTFHRHGPLRCRFGKKCAFAHSAQELRFTD